MLENELYLDFNDVLIKPRISELQSRKEVDLKATFLTDWQPIPIMSANMDTVTDTNIAFILAQKNWVSVLHKFVDKEPIYKLFDQLEEHGLDKRNVFVSRGTSEHEQTKLKDRLEAEPRIKSVCIDVANGYRREVFDYVKSLREGLCRDKILMVGNIATPDAAIEYARIGVDIIKCGIGPGAGCITRVQTGVGVPQISMILKIKEALEEYGASKTLICSDGGCKRPGDIAKAFVAGADFVMLGGMLAGHNESPGEITYSNGKKLKRFSGMAAAQSQWSGVPMYGVEEGKTVFIDLKGSILETINEIEGGLRSACTYTNSKTTMDLKKAFLIRTNVQENRIFS